MKDLTKITIKSTSGWCSIYMSYTDVLVLTSNSITYRYCPSVESIINSKIIWSYKSNSNFFNQQFIKIKNMINSKKIDNYLNSNECFDVGSICFVFTHSDGSVFKTEGFVDLSEFKELFDEIKVLVPRLEEMPKVLETGD